MNVWKSRILKQNIGKNIQIFAKNYSVIPNYYYS